MLFSNMVLSLSLGYKNISHGEKLWLQKGFLQRIFPLHTPGTTTYLRSFNLGTYASPILPLSIEFAIL